MHRFIVYQYGKVGSTSVVNALDQLPETEAFQSHFLGEAAFSEPFNRLQDPAVSDYVFEHSAGQLIENLRIYRHYLRRGTSDNRLTIISLAREPFDWFRSSGKTGSRSCTRSSSVGCSLRAYCCSAADQ